MFKTSVNQQHRKSCMLLLMLYKFFGEKKCMFTLNHNVLYGGLCHCLHCKCNKAFAVPKLNQGFVLPKHKQIVWVQKLIMYFAKQLNLTKCMWFANWTKFTSNVEPWSRKWQQHLLNVRPGQNLLGWKCVVRQSDFRTFCNLVFWQTFVWASCLLAFTAPQSHILHATHSLI